MEDRREPDEGIYTIEMITEDGPTGKTIECLAITREFFESEVANGSAKVDTYVPLFDDTLHDVLRSMLTVFGKETIKKPCLDISLNQDISENLAALMSEEVTGQFTLKTLEILMAVGESHLIVIDPQEVMKFI